MTASKTSFSAKFKPHASYPAKSIALATIVFACHCFCMNAQSPSTVPPTTLPDAPRPQAPSPYRVASNAGYMDRLGFICGVGASTSPSATKPAGSCGAGMTLLPLPLFLEVGLIAPQANRSYLSGYISLDSSIPLAPLSSRYLPLAIVGYSRLFETGHAFVYGVALALPRSGKKNDSESLRIELRDYWTFANPAQHNVMLRVGRMSEETD